MSSLLATLRSPNYVRALSRALEATEEARQSLLDSLLSDPKPPTGWVAEEWLDTRAAYQLAYEVGTNEPGEDVGNEIRKALANTSADYDSWLDNFLAPNPAVNARMNGLRERDAMLPNLYGMWSSVDLRVLSEGDNDNVVVAPIITIRLSFDEHVGGQDSISFQVAPELLPTYEKAFRDAREQVEALGNTVTVRVPKWAVPEESDD